MSVEVKVPVLPESVPDATLLDWKKQPGDAVEIDEVLIELETDKVVLEVPAPESGVLTGILKQTGETALSQEVLATIEAGASATKPAADTPKSAAPTQEAVAAPPPVQPQPVAATEQAVVSAAPSVAPAGSADGLSPAVRKLIVEHKLDANAVSGTGPNGRITKGDVLAHIGKSATSEPAVSPAAVPATAAPAANPAAAPGARTERREPMSRLRSRIAERLVQAQQTAAILTTFNEVNMQPVMDLRKRHKEGFLEAHGTKLGFMSFFAKASVAALKRFPAVNAYIEGNELVYHDYYDIGVAVSSPRGLVVPIVRDVDQLSFAGIEAAIGHFAQQASDGTLSIDDLTGGTFTISNGGVFGSMLSTPILNPPQSAILGMHKTDMRPVVIEGEIVARPMMYLALSYDHRIVDGREAVQFLVTIKEALEDPGRMLLDL